MRAVFKNLEVFGNLESNEKRREPLRDRVKRQRRNRRRRMLMVFLTIFLFISAASASYFVFSSYNSMNRRVNDETVMVAEDKLLIMVMGVDRREDDVGRSDTLLLATVDPEQKKAALLSIPRDTRVRIEGHGYDKINHAYAYGGHELSRETVEGLIGAKVDQYILIDTHAFERIIDALGGIDIEVEKSMYYEDPWDDDGGLVIDIAPGEQHMDGSKAIQYVRYRDSEGDIGRIKRQQKFIRAVVEKAATPSIIVKLPSIVKEINDAVETDLSLSRMVSLIGMVKEIRENGIESAMLPGTPAYIDDVSYWIPNLKEVRPLLAELLNVKMSEKAAEAMQQEADEYERSIPKEMKMGESGEAKDAKQEEKEKKEQEAAREKLPDVLDVEIVNASGIDGAAARLRDRLTRQGFNVTGVSTLSAPYENTTLITHTDDERLLERFYNLDFSYVVRTSKNGDPIGSVTLVIGRDYKEE